MANDKLGLGMFDPHLKLILNHLKLIIYSIKVFLDEANVCVHRLSTRNLLLPSVAITIQIFSVVLVILGLVCG